MADLTYRRNRELVRLLSRLRWSPERLAKEVNEAVGSQQAINSTTPYHWRDRGRVPREPYGRVVCEVLSRATGTPVAYEQLWQRRDGAGPRSLDIPLVEAPWTPEAALAALSLAAERVVSLHKPGDVLSTAALHTAGRRWIDAAARPPAGGGRLRVEEAQLTDLRLTVRSKARLDAAYGGGLVRDPLREEARFALQLLQYGRYDAESGARLYAAAADLARLAGWASFDCGEHAAAQRFLLAGLRLAHVSGDRVLGARILGCLGVQATYIADAEDAVALLASALDGGGVELPASERALMFGRLARARARLGDGPAARAAAERAFAALDGDGGPGGPGPDFGAVSDSDAVSGAGAVSGADAVSGAGPEQDRAELLGLVGEAHLILSEPAEAAGYLERAVRALTPARSRSRALLLVRLAESRLRLGLAEEAARAAEQARALDVGMRSPRVTAALAEYRRRVAQGPQSAQPAGRRSAGRRSAPVPARAPVPGARRPGG
jgi:hypothetical protein